MLHPGGHLSSIWLCDRMLSNYKLIRWSCIENSKCPLYEDHEEVAGHLYSLLDHFHHKFGPSHVNGKGSIDKLWIGSRNYYGQERSIVDEIYKLLLPLSIFTCPIMVDRGSTIIISFPRWDGTHVEGSWEHSYRM